MIAIGQMNTLKVLRSVPFGMYLDGGEAGDILIPKKYIPDNTTTGQDLTVFIYLDSEDRLIATTRKPFAMVGDFAWLKVLALNQQGAFADWGLEKDLFIPFREQNPAKKFITGKYYLLRIYLDEQSGRIAASQRFRRFLETPDPATIHTGDPMELIVYEKTPIGWKVIAENRFVGLLYANELYGKPINSGNQLTAYVKKLREDGRIDFVLQKSGIEAISGFTEVLYRELQRAGGFIALTDNSSPELIYQRLKVSKKVFKKAVGGLYKARKIRLEKDGIQLIN